MIFLTSNSISFSKSDKYKRPQNLDVKTAQFFTIQLLLYCETLFHFLKFTFDIYRHIMTLKT